MKKLIVLFTVLLMFASLQAQPWGGRDNVKVLSGWISAATSPIAVVGSDSVFYVNLGAIRTNDYILTAHFHTLDAWSNNAPADSACIGTESDIDAIVNETSCETVGEHSSAALAAARIYSVTDGTTYGRIRGYKRITSDGSPRSSGGKIYFIVTYIEGVSEP
jgi:hypothetical protein